MNLENKKELYSRLLVRAVYDDHTAWLMAELSRLAYIRFDDVTKAFENYIEKITDLDIDDSKSELKRFIEKTILQGDTQSGVEDLSKELNEGGFELVSTFSHMNAQAYLVKRELDRTAVLVFRGSEYAAPADLKADLRSSGGIYDLGNGRVHRGMWEAYQNLEASISYKLESLLDFKVYITGHSLGGGLATIAARELSHPGIVACYTFGAPPVVDYFYGINIEVPIYRIVNANDIVPQFAKAYTLDTLISFAYMIPIRFMRSWLVNFLNRIPAYRHCGEVHYLINKKGLYDDVNMILNPDVFDRFRSQLSHIASGGYAGFKDHSINEYCNKLRAFALRRWVDRG